MINVTKVKTLDDYNLYLEFSDGKKGIFSVRPYLSMTVFHELKNKEYFDKARVAFGTVVWPNEQDIAPETLYADLIEVERSDAA